MSDENKPPISGIPLVELLQAERKARIEDIRLFGIEQEKWSKQIESMVVEIADEREFNRNLRLGLKAMLKQCRDSNEPTAISLRIQISKLLGHALGPATRHCPICDRVRDSEDGACQSCGHEFEPAAQPQRSEPIDGVREILNQYFGVEMSISAERAMERIAAIMTQKPEQPPATDDRVKEEQGSHATGQEWTPENLDKVLDYWNCRPSSISETEFIQKICDAHKAELDAEREIREQVERDLRIESKVSWSAQIERLEQQLAAEREKRKHVPLTPGDLAPCPFCGSTNVGVEPLTGGFVVDCKDCGGGCGTCHDEQAARDEWNKRETLPIADLAVKFCEAHREDYEAMRTSDSMDIDTSFILLCEAVWPPQKGENHNDANT
jgi:transcription elongation factor Elf1